MAYRDVILSKTVDYVRAKKLAAANRGAIVMVDCPFCHYPKSAQIIPALAHIKCVHCSKMFTLIDLIRFIENKFNDSEESILNYVKDLLKIDVQTTQNAEDLEKLLQVYESRHWALVPCAKKGKAPIQAEWQKKENRTPTEWFHWISSGLNVGVRTGSVSNITVLDFDLLSRAEKAELVKPGLTDKRKEEILQKKVIPESIKSLMGETLMQETHGGFQAFYSYSDLPKTAINEGELHIDLENDGGQVVIPPSYQVGVEEEYLEGEVKKKRIVGYASRAWINQNPIIPIPEPLLAWIKARLKNAPKTSSDVSGKPEVQIAQIPDDFKVKDLQSNRNNTLMALGGAFRKELNIKQTGYVLHVLNKHLLEDPLPSQEIAHILEGLDKYVGFDEAELANDIIEYLKETDTASKTEIESAVFGQRATSENKKRLDKTLMYLIREEKIIKKNSREYKILRNMEWDDQILNVGLPVNIKVPYFHDYAHFNFGDLILIGSPTKYGKSTLAMNIVKRLVDQGIKPYYVYNESGGRFGKNALALGLKDGDFYRCRCGNPAELIIKPNSVVVYDWIKPTDFAKTDALFETLIEKLEKTNSLMIGFAQLREKSKDHGANSWFAQDLIRQFVAMSVKYLYDDKDGINTYFEVNDVRDSKTHGKVFKIPCKYIRETREVKMQEEIEREEADIKAALEKQKEQKATKPEEPKNENPTSNDGSGTSA
jgi:hypothetical protein